jgi:hypothetical protein
MLIDYVYSKLIKNLVFRLIEKALYNEYEGEYIGYEEQGMSYEEWKESKKHPVKYKSPKIGHIQLPNNEIENENAIEITV